MDVCLASHERVKMLLEDPRLAATDDVAEFIAAMDSLQLVLRGVQARGQMPEDPAVLPNLVQEMVTYEKLLRNLKKQGRLKRFLTNNRLRKRLDKTNMRLCLLVNDLDAATGGTGGTAGGLMGGLQPEVSNDGNFYSPYRPEAIPAAASATGAPSHTTSPGLYAGFGGIASPVPGAAAAAAAAAAGTGGTSGEGEQGPGYVVRPGPSATTPPTPYQPSGAYPGFGGGTPVSPGGGIYGHRADVMAAGQQQQQQQQQQHQLQDEVPPPPPPEDDYPGPPVKPVATYGGIVAGGGQGSTDSPYQDQAPYQDPSPQSAGNEYGSASPRPGSGTFSPVPQLQQPQPPQQQPPPPPRLQGQVGLAPQADYGPMIANGQAPAAAAAGAGPYGADEEFPPAPPPEVGDAEWVAMFGHQHVVTWDAFVDRLRDFTPLLTIEEFVLKDVLDHSHTGSVNRFKFREFMKGFGGDISVVVKTMMTIYHASYFHGFVTQTEARRFLELEPYGAFLVRFSSSQPGSFVIEYVTFCAAASAGGEYGVVDENPVGPAPPVEEGPTLKPSPHTAVNSVVVTPGPEGLSVATARGGVKTFESLEACITAFSRILVFPFETTLTKEPWFHGDLDSTEVEELLAGQPTGTFLVRFSSQPGCFASSFVTEQNTIGKSLISRVADGYRLESSANRTVYPQLRDLVKAYIRAGFFRLPYNYAESTQVTDKMMQPGARQTPGWVTQPVLQRIEKQNAAPRPPPRDMRAMIGRMQVQGVGGFRGGVPGRPGRPGGMGAGMAPPGRPAGRPGAAAAAVRGGPHPGGAMTGGAAGPAAARLGAGGFAQPGRGPGGGGPGVSGGPGAGGAMAPARPARRPGGGGPGGAGPGVGRPGPGVPPMGPGAGPGRAGNGGGPANPGGAAVGVGRAGAPVGGLGPARGGGPAGGPGRPGAGPGGPGSPGPAGRPGPGAFPRPAARTAPSGPPGGGGAPGMMGPRPPAGAPPPNNRAGNGPAGQGFAPGSPGRNGPGAMQRPAAKTTVGPGPPGMRGPRPPPGRPPQRAAGAGGGAGGAPMMMMMGPGSGGGGGAPGGRPPARPGAGPGRPGMRGPRPPAGLPPGRGPPPPF